MVKRVLSLFLTILTVFSLMIPAFAVEEDWESLTDEQVQELIDAGEAFQLESALGAEEVPLTEEIPVTEAVSVPEEIVAVEEVSETGDEISDNEPVPAAADPVLSVKGDANRDAVVSGVSPWDEADLLTDGGVLCNGSGYLVLQDGYYISSLEGGTQQQFTVTGEALLTLYAEKGLSCDPALASGTYTVYHITATGDAVTVTISETESTDETDGENGHIPPSDSGDTPSEPSPPSVTETPDAMPAPYPCTAPVLTSVTNTATGVKITWGKVTGAAKYRVFYKNGSSWKKIADTAATSYTWTGAKAGTKYTFTVRCISADGKSYTSPYDSKGITGAYVKTPQVSKLENAVTGVKISWNKVSGAEKYRVYYKTSGGSWKKITDTTSTSYTWTGGKSGTKYSFTLRCLSSDGKSFTSSYNNTGKSITYIAAPKLTAVTGSAEGVTVTWDKVTGAAKYRVFYKTGGGSWTKIADTTSTSYTWTGARDGTAYTFTVRCVTSDGKSYASGYTSGKSITYKEVLLAAPKLSSMTNTATGIKITWGAVSGATQYRVFYKNGSSWKKIADTAATSYTWSGAKANTRYTFTVRCITSVGGSYASGYDAAGKSITTLNVEWKNGVAYAGGYLIVNKTYPLPASYGSDLTKETQAAFQRMAADARATGMNIYIYNGFRSYSLQSDLYTRYVNMYGVAGADASAARPGYSEHQSGLAIDVNAYAGTREASWMARNCYKYGFILRFPQGKTNETGYKYEPWHFRYVGTELATILYNGGNWITMEAYFGLTSQYQ